MHTDEYIEFIDDFLTEEVNLSLTPALIKKLAHRAKILEKETDFTLDDISGELSDVLVEKVKPTDDTEYFLSELAGLVLDEIEAQAEDTEEEYYGESEDE